MVFLDSFTIATKPLTDNSQESGNDNIKLINPFAFKLKSFLFNIYSISIWENQYTSFPSCMIGTNNPIICIRINIGAEDGSIPAKVSENIRAIDTDGLAKLVEDVS